MRNFEADKLVRVGDVAKLLRDAELKSAGSHSVCLGAAGEVDVDCDALNIDIESILRGLGDIEDRTQP